MNPNRTLPSEVVPVVAKVGIALAPKVLVAAVETEVVAFAVQRMYPVEE